MIAKSELLMGRDTEYASEYTQEISDNLDKLLIPLNQIRTAYNIPMIVNSGWRPAEINAATPGAAAHSKHMIGLACDIKDNDSSLWAWVLNNLTLMQQLGIFMEDKRYTPGWVHFQLGAPGSGKRIFIPSAAPAPAPDAWDGNYDHSYDQ